MMQNETLECVDCQEKFIWTISEQQFHKDNNYLAPKRCKPCRLAKKKRFEEREKQQR